MTGALPFRTRFRFRLLKPLNIKDEKHRFAVGGREIDLSSRVPGAAICKSEWLIANARGFETEAEARCFAVKLKAAAETASVACRLGIDTGVDLPTSRFSQFVKDRIQEERGLTVRDDIHGIDVIADDPNVRFPFFSASGTVMQAPDPFLSDLTRFLDTAEAASQTTRDIVLLLNYALMRPEPVAQIVFAFSAVEMLGQQEQWSANQQAVLKKVADHARGLAIGTEDELREVSEAILRTHKLGLRQGVLRLLGTLELDYLKDDWDRLYAERSTLIHGLFPRPGANYNDLAFRAVSLCGRILLKTIARDLPGADRHVDLFYRA